MSHRILLLSALLLVVLPGIALAGAPPAPAPEPVSALLVAMGATGLAVRAYRKRK